MITLRKLFLFGFSFVDSRRQRKSVVIRGSLQFVPAVPEHDPLLRVRRTARAVRHVPLPGRPDGLAGERGFCERLGGLAQQLATPKSDQRLEGTREVTVDDDADDRVDESAGEGEEDDGEVDRVAVILTGRDGDDCRYSVRGPATAAMHVLLLLMLLIMMITRRRGGGGR